MIRMSERCYRAGVHTHYGMRKKASKKGIVENMHN